VKETPFFGKKKQKTFVSSVADFINKSFLVLFKKGLLLLRVPHLRAR
jgi:hypothetical protein